MIFPNLNGQNPQPITDVAAFRKNHSIRQAEYVWLEFGIIKAIKPIFYFQEKHHMLLQGNLQGLQHLGLPVTDLERSKAFYMQLGFTEAMRMDIQPQTEIIRVAMMEHENFTIELYQLGPEERQEIAGRSDGHIDHVALNVLDVAQAHAELKAAGLKILEDNAPVYLPFGEHGVKYFTVRGPDGEKVEFNQILK